MGNKILITGSTGNIGTEIIKLLKTKNVDFVAGTTSGQSIDGAKTVKFDFADSDSMKNALQGITTLFLLLPSHSDVVNWGENVIKLAQESSVKHIVRSSGSFANENSDLLIEKLLGSTDKFLKESGMNYTSTAPSSFASLNLLHNILEFLFASFSPLNT